MPLPHRMPLRRTIIPSIAALLLLSSSPASVWSASGVPTAEAVRNDAPASFITEGKTRKRRQLRSSVPDDPQRGNIPPQAHPGCQDGYSDGNVDGPGQPLPPGGIPPPPPPAEGEDDQSDTSSDDGGGFGFGNSQNGGATNPGGSNATDDGGVSDSNSTHTGFNGGGGGGGNGGSFNPDRPRDWEDCIHYGETNPTVSPAPVDSIAPHHFVPLAPALSPVFSPISPTFPSPVYTPPSPVFSVPGDTIGTLEYEVSVGATVLWPDMLYDVATVMTEVLNRTTPFALFGAIRRRLGEDAALLVVNVDASHFRNLTFITDDVDAAPVDSETTRGEDVGSNETGTNSTTDGEQTTPPLSSLRWWRCTIAYDIYVVNGTLEKISTQVRDAVVESITTGEFLELLKQYSSVVEAVTLPGQESNTTVPGFGSEEQEEPTVIATLDPAQWDLRGWIGLGLFGGTVILLLVLTRTARHRRKQWEEQQNWGIRLATDHDINELLTYGWQQDGQKLTFYDKTKLVYNEDDSMLIGGVPYPREITSPSSGTS